MMKPYKPRRASEKWLEGAPEYVLDVFDHPKFVDRYSVLFGGSLLDPALLADRRVYMLCMSGDPEYGYSQWSSCPATWRPSKHRIKWADLPQHIKDHVEMRVKQCHTIA